MSTSIPRRTLGQGLSVSAIGLGCMGMSEFYGPSDRAESRAVLNHALDIGIDFLDTADMYGSGENERLLAEVLRTRRHEVVLATKFGNVRGPNGEFLGIDGSPEYVAKACDASLQRLGVAQIDLYYQHRVDPKVPIEDTVGAMKRLVEAGKVRWLGLSEASGKTVRRAHAIHPIAALQSEYSLWTREIEHDALPVCDELGVGFVAYSPLGRGFLTGAIPTTAVLDAGDYRRMNPRFADGNIDVNRHLLDAVTTIAKARDVTPAQLAIAWLLHQGRNIVPIPGTRKVSRLDENAAAARIALSVAELAQIRTVLDASEVAGTRYPATGMAFVNA